MNHHLEIVTHCYNPPGTSQYAELLKWQVASLVHHTPDELRVQLTVFFTPDDEATVSRLRYSSMHIGTRKNVLLNPVALAPGALFRRSIGRNIAARATDADVIWFTDVDYAFGPGCLDAAHKAAAFSVIPLHMPEQIKISFDNGGMYSSHPTPHHMMGAVMIRNHREDELPQLNDECFRTKNQGPCIGGVQIVVGSWARQNGYLHGHDKWQTEVDPSLGFRSCKCDAAFRRVNNLNAHKHPIPNVYRIRHLMDGRDINLAGESIGKEAW